MADAANKRYIALTITPTLTSQHLLQSTTSLSNLAVTSHYSHHSRFHLAQIAMGCFNNLQHLFRPQEVHVRRISKPLEAMKLLIAAALALVLAAGDHQVLLPKAPQR